MRHSVRLIWQTVKVFLLFTFCTILFYYGLIWINEEYEGYHRYDKPNGAAVKVSAQTEGEEASWFNRLLLFYLDGE